MLLHGLRRFGPELEGEHSGTMRSIHNCFTDPCDAAIAAADHEQSMKFIICLGPSEKIILCKATPIEAFKASKLSIPQSTTKH